MQTLNLKKIIKLALFILITAAIRATMDAWLGAEAVVSQTVTMLTGAGILYIVLEG